MPYQDRILAKRAKISPTLPREVILQIAQLVPDEASFFAYIEALKGTTSDQGAIEALRSLCRTIYHSHLWPNLALHPMDADEWELAIQAIPVYTTVKMHARDDLHRLVGRVSPSTNLIVIHDKPKRMRQWFGLLANLPVRGLLLKPKGFFADDTPIIAPLLLNVWPSMTYLRCLELPVGDQASLGSICKYMATSRITELRLEGRRSVDGGVPYTNLGGAALTDLAAWLQSTKVIRFDLTNFRVICDDDLMHALNRAFAASDAMRRILWDECAIHISCPMVLPPRLQTLCLSRCTFELMGIDFILKQLPALPYLTYVRIDGTTMTPTDVNSLASVLAQTNVSHLDLEDCSLGDGTHDNESILRLASAIESSPSLRTLRLMHNGLDSYRVKAILAAVQRRPYVTAMVKL